MTIICSIILFITWSFSFLNAIRISKVPGHYSNYKTQYSTARTAVIRLILPGGYGSHAQGPLFLEFQSKMKLGGLADLISEPSYKLDDP